MDGIAGVAASVPAGLTEGVTGVAKTGVTASVKTVVMTGATVGVTASMTATAVSGEGVLIPPAASKSQPGGTHLKACPLHGIGPSGRRSGCSSLLFEALMKLVQLQWK